MVVVGRPPNDPASTPVLQLLRSLETNLRELPSLPLLLLPSTHHDALQLTSLVAAKMPTLQTTVLPLSRAIRIVSPSSRTDIDRIPEMLRRRMLAARSAWAAKLHVRDIGRYTSLYRSIHQAVAVRYATRILGCESVLLLRPEAYLWRRVSIQELLAGRRDVYFAE